MEGRRFIRTIRLDSILSFGPNNEEFALEPLNVLIGPNASGKSNFIEALSILHAAPRDLQVPTREGGGVQEWMWKGEPESPPSTIDVILPFSTTAIRYRISFTEDRGRFRLFDEGLESENQATNIDKNTYEGLSEFLRQPLIWGDAEFHIFYRYGFTEKPLIEALTLEEDQIRRRKIELTM